MFTQMFSGLKWWEVVVCGIPMILLFVGGAIGGAIGAGGTILNLKIWKKKYSPPIKASLIFGVTVACFFAYFIIAGIFLSLIG